VFDVAIGDLHLAGPAQAMTAGVREVDPRTQAGVEDGLPILDFDGLTERFNGQLIAHRCT